MKNRTTLRSYFFSGSIPTEMNFHELINSGLNQEEDGIRRAVNGPLELEAQGAAGEMLHLYGSFRDSTPALWRIGHKTALAGAAGLNIADAKASRLFIKADDGSVGIGTDAPAKTLDVVGAIGLRNGGAAWDHLYLHHDGATAFVTAGGAESGLALRVSNTNSGSYDSANQNYKEVMRLLPNGNVGIGTTAPNSRLSISPNAVEPKITLWDGNNATNHYGFGISGSQLNYHVYGPDNRHVFYAGGKNGDGTELLRIQGNGSVGIGTTAPAARLQVVSADNANTTNIFDAQAQNLTYGTGLWYGGVRSTGTNGNNTLALDGQKGGHVVLNANGGTGNVGIGTSAPAAKLDVNGDIFIGGKKPIIVKRFNNLGDNVNYNTSYSSATYAAAITGMNAKGGDIDEGAASAASIIDCRMYIREGTWWIRADFKSHNGNENWDIDVLFIDRRMADLINFG